MASHQKQLCGAVDCIKIVFPCETSRPSLRTFRSWQSKGWLPVHKIGSHLTFFDPEEVRAALDRRFRVNPVEPPLTHRRNPIMTRLILSAEMLAALLAAVGNLTAQFIILLTE